MSNNKTVVPLTAQERNVLSDFARGDVPVQIAKQTGLTLDQVTGILVQRTGMSRPRAADLIADPNPAESPLTASIPPIPVRKPPAKATPPVAPIPAVALAANIKQGLATAAQALLEPPALAEPPVVEAASDPLDVGLDAVSERLRALVVSLAETIANRRLADVARRRVAELEAQLEQARADLAEAEAGGTP